MSYYVDIIDTTSTSTDVLLQKAQKSSIVLEWNGGDEKDVLNIVGSSLKFTLLSEDASDATFSVMFTGNESRFKIELKKSSDDTIIWSGFLLPDLYNEPYKNVNFFVNFEATDGLGRLKGKYLPEEYYRDEKSVIDIYCAILLLTGLNLDLYFSPAIDNSINKNWDTIYIDTLTFVDGKKKLDAYAIFEILLSDMLCVCYQADNRWYIEGLNKRNSRDVIFKKYDSTGTYVSEIGITKLLKSVTALGLPNVTMIPQYGEITVAHEREPQGFPDTIAKEKNEGWVVISGVIGKVYATDWNGNNGYYCRCEQPNYYNVIEKGLDDHGWGGVPDVEPFDETKFINLKSKIFVYKYQKLRLNFELRIKKYFSEGEVEFTDSVNSVKYEIKLNNTVLYTNRQDTVPENQNLIFENETAKLDFDFTASEDGLLDVLFWRPEGGLVETNILSYEIVEMKLEPIAFEEEYLVVDQVTDDFTVTKDIELTYADDNTGFSKAFRLAKLREATISYNTIEIPVLYRFVQNGKDYSVVDLDGANLIKDNINTVYHDGDLLENLEVTYNYNSGEQMVVKTDFPTTESFFVNVYKTDDVGGNRDYWQQWTDSIYKIETARYPKVVSNIIRRMFGVVCEKIDCSVRNAVKFNDMVDFKYVTQRQYQITNCSWDLDSNTTSVTMSRAIYKDSGDTGGNPLNIPPIVNAGVDIVMEDDQTTVSLEATAYDVDGFIVSQLWEKLSGDAGDVIVSPTQLVTDITGLTGDVYEYKITVVDNDGATANDSLVISRRKDYVVDLELITLVGNGYQPYLRFEYLFVIDPEIDPSHNLVMNGRFFMILNRSLVGDFARARIKKNSVVIFEAELQFIAGTQYFPFTLGYIAGDEIIFEVEQTGEFPSIHFGSCSIYLDSVEFVTGVGNITGPPIHAQAIPGFVP